jgi:hypothetical protein
MQQTQTNSWTSSHCEPSSSRDGDGRVDAPPTLCDAVLAEAYRPTAVKQDGENKQQFSEDDKVSTSNNNNKRALDKSHDSDHKMPSLGSLTYSALFRHSDAGRRLSQSLPSLNYHHRRRHDNFESDGEDLAYDGHNYFDPEGGNDDCRAQWITNVLNQVSQTDHNDCLHTAAAGSSCDAQHDDEQAAAARRLYGYADDDSSLAERFRNEHLGSSPSKRRRTVLRRNSFVIPRGRGLVPGLLDLQTAGKFHFGPTLSGRDVGGEEER